MMEGMKAQGMLLLAQWLRQAGAEAAARLATWDGPIEMSGALYRVNVSDGIALG